MLSPYHLHEPGQLEQTGSHRPLPGASVDCTDTTVWECAKAEDWDGDLGSCSGSVWEGSSRSGVWVLLRDSGTLKILSERDVAAVCSC